MSKGIDVLFHRVVHIVMDDSGYDNGMTIVAVCSTPELADEAARRQVTERGGKWNEMKRTESLLGRPTTARWECGLNWIVWEAHVIDFVKRD